MRVRSGYRPDGGPVGLMGVLLGALGPTKGGVGVKGEPWAWSGVYCSPGGGGLAVSAAHGRLNRFLPCPSLKSLYAWVLPMSNSHARVGNMKNAKFLCLSASAIETASGAPPIAKRANMVI